MTADHQAPHAAEMVTCHQPPRPLPPRRRVLIVTQATVDGVAACVRDLAHAAIQQGYELTVACPSDGVLASWAQERCVPWDRLDMRRSPHPSDLVALRRLRHLARSHDLVHLHSSKAGAVGRVALASLGSRRPPSVFTPHGWSWLVGGWLAPAYRVLERAMLPLTTAVVAVSPEERSDGRLVLGPRAAQIKVIPNGVDTHRFRPDGPVAPRGGAPLVVSVGRFCHQHGQDLAVRALWHMRTPGVRLRLVGDGVTRAGVEQQARRLGVAGRVELPGFLLDPTPHFRAADVVLVPSRYDGMSLVLLEAMACGAAVVATRVPGSSALRGVGVLVPVGDPKAMAEAVDALLADAGRRARLGEAARERVADQYSLQRSLDAILALWRDLGRFRCSDYR